MQAMMLVEERDVWMMAKALIDEHGRGAVAHAACQVYELAQAGDPQGAGLWKRVSAAVREILRRNPVGRVH